MTVCTAVTERSLCTAADLAALPLSDDYDHYGYMQFFPAASNIPNGTMRKVRGACARALQLHADAWCCFCMCCAAPVAHALYADDS